MKILIQSISLMKKGGVTNYAELLKKQLECNGHIVIHIQIGTSKNLLINCFLPLIILKQLITFKSTGVREKPDVIHLNPSLQLIPIVRDFLYLKIAKIINIPTLFFIHGWIESFYEKIKDTPILKRIFYKNISKADAIVVLSKKYKEKLVRLGIDSKKIYVSSTMIETTKYLSENKDFNPPYNILFCGSMIKDKGPYELLNAIPLVIENYPKTEFIFAGQGIALKGLKEKVKKMKIKNNVEFTHFIAGEKKLTIFKLAHIYALPSYYEGFPTTILEAMAAGSALIFTPVGGLADALVNGKNGFFIKSMPPNSSDIAKKIIYLIEHPDLMKRMSENNIKEAKERYDALAVTKKIEKIYREIYSNQKL